MKETVLTYTLAFILVGCASPLRKCEEIDQDVICQCQGYNLTYFPTDRFSSQSRAKIQFSQFENLIRTNCSSHLLRFLCSRYFPPCDPDWPNFNYILPCRELCEKVRGDCEPVLKRYGAKWSQELSCDAFKSVNDTTRNGPPCIGTDLSTTKNSGAECKVKEKCVDIQHARGKSASYKTYFPNAVTTSQANASKQLNDILKKKCSLEAEQFFIISHYPPCTEANNTVHLLYPCKQLCRRIKRECEGKLGGKAKWPDYMDCQKLSKDRCVNDMSSYFVKPSPTSSTSTVAKSSTPLPVATPTPKPLQSCKKFIETSCDELNSFSGLPKVTFPEYKKTFAKYTKLLNSSCSVWLKPFLCYAVFSAYKSTDSTQRVKPCRNVCRKAENECASCFGKRLSADLWNCQDFPVKKNCVGLNDLSNYSSSKGNKFDSSCPITNNDKVCNP